MTTRHTVEQGESLLGLADRYGVPPDYILDHPDNRELRDRKRKTSILHPGDVLTIPDPVPKVVEGETGRRHRFRLQTRRVTLRVRLSGPDEDWANEPYKLILQGGEERTGTLDAEGQMEEEVPADTPRAVLRVGEEHVEEFNLLVSHMDPIEETTGVQKRLNNLGFFCGNEDGDPGPHTRGALEAFQSANGLEVTGELDDATKSRLEEDYGC
jgi:N-acetylmuramoyl-L-alanine amidase